LAFSTMNVPLRVPTKIEFDTVLILR
jgi:hypothetical protein